MRTTVSIIFIVIGLIWKYWMTILSGLGRMFDLIELGDRITDFQVWLVNNPELANVVGPWVLVGIGFLSLVATHAGPPLYRAWKQDDLEIIYDPTDEQGRFGGVGLWQIHKSSDPPHEAFIFRIGVQNNTRKTIYEVEGTVEGDLIQHNYPVALRFTRTLDFKGTLHPKRMLLMDVIAMSPDPAEWPSGNHFLTVRVNGQDTSESVREFCFDRSRMPAMYLRS